MWKDILVFADASVDGLARLDLARDLSQRYGAHLEAQMVSVAPRRHVGPATAGLEDVYQDVLKASRAAAAIDLATIRDRDPTNKAFSAFPSEVFAEGVRARAAVLARLSDLVVLGQPETGDHSNLDTEILMGALFASGQPCLMFPRWIMPHVWGRRVLIAWKGTPQAARAVQAALPLLQTAEAVRLLVVDPREGEHGEDQRTLARLVTRLSRHGARVEAQVSAKSGYDDQVGRAITDEAEAFGADLLVMGAFGHPRFTEFVFGGVSRHIIHHARMPVLMTH